jgi:myosin heavy subunit
VVDRNERFVVAEDNAGQIFSIPVESALFVKPSSVKNVADLLHLDEFTEGHLLHAVRTRFFEDDIYTAVGSQVLLAVNPYKSLDCYTEDRRTQLDSASHSDLIQSSPHIFKVAELAYRNLQ